jgi:hypothetical protein
MTRPRPPKATNSTRAKGRRFKLFPDGDVAVFTKREPDGDLVPVLIVDTESTQKPAQFHSVKNACSWIKSEKNRFVNQKVIVVVFRTIFEFQVEGSPRVRVIERERILADPKSVRTLISDSVQNGAPAVNLPGEDV